MRKNREFASFEVCGIGTGESGAFVVVAGASSVILHRLSGVEGRNRCLETSVWGLTSVYGIGGAVGVGGAMQPSSQAAESHIPDRLIELLGQVLAVFSKKIADGLAEEAGR